LSSTTDFARGGLRPDRRQAAGGQIVVIFAIALVALLGIAALVFDAGQNLLDRRTEQNVADAAALAGARYLPSNPGTWVGVCGTGTISFAPAARACAVAADNGYVDGVAGHSVTVRIPPGPESQFSNLPDYIEVSVGNTRPSFFAGILGMATQSTGAMGVARNGASGALPYSLLALDPSGCSVNKITGSPGSSVVVDGAIQVDSNCSTSALLVSGNGLINAPECDIVGAMQVSGGAVNNCAVYDPGSQVSGDPLRDLDPPAEPADLGNVVAIGTSKAVPPSCPTGGPVTDAIRAAAPSTCNFTASYSSTDTYRLYPGYYPGGITLKSGTFYLEPGIYWLAGTGFQMNGSGATVMSVDTAGTTFGGGVLLYNTETPAFDTQCAADPSYNAGCFGPIKLNGQTATVDLKPIQDTIYKGMVVFQDRANSNTITLNGGSTTFDVEGTIYAPAALVQLNGSGTVSIAAQIIAYDFQANGSGGALTITYNNGGLFQLEGVGLVQ
jgi:hypothetical protein